MPYWPRVEAGVAGAAVCAGDERAVSVVLPDAGVFADGVLAAVVEVVGPSGTADTEAPAPGLMADRDPSYELPLAAAVAAAVMFGGIFWLLPVASLIHVAGVM